MSAVVTEKIVSLAQQLRAAPHGEKSALYKNASAELGLSQASLMRRMKSVALTKTRKQRSDAGKVALTPDEALHISALIVEQTRKNNKRLMPLGDAVAALREAGLIAAEWIDQETGEVRPLSVSAISRALRTYRMHPDQVAAPAPVTSLQSEHPNHCWQVDASLCTLYYLGNGLHGLRSTDPKAHYKNKPGNLEKISANRVWRYAITDHASGWIYVEYVLGAESGENLVSVLINAMQERGGGWDMLHGVPRILMTDPGAAMTGALFRNLCRSLRIELIINEVGNARAKGQVENAHNLIETKFEPGLKLQRIDDLADLNAKARDWRVRINAEHVHSRHGMTRSAAWARITAGQLIKAPSVEICRELAVSLPEQRRVSPKLRVSFHGREYDVAGVPDVIVGEKLLITRNPWRADAAQVVLRDADGREIFHVIDAVEKGAFGFDVAAPVIGQRHARHAETPAQKAGRAMERLAMDVATDEEAAAARKGRKLPFGGRIDLFKPVDESAMPTPLPRRGQEHELSAPRVVFQPLTVAEAARTLKARIEAAGGKWSPDHYAHLAQRYPDGVPADDIDAIGERLLRDGVGPLRIVGGESC